MIDYEELVQRVIALETTMASLLRQLKERFGNP